MGVRDCLDRAAAAGEITREEAAYLQDRFETEFAQARLSLDDDAAAATAKARLKKALRAEAIIHRRIVLWERRVETLGRDDAYPDLRRGGHDRP